MSNYQTLTREKHLNHLVRVVPLLTLAYGIQGYLMMSWSQEQGPTGFLVLMLGLSLALSVGCMVTYDQRHQVNYNDDGFDVKAPWSFSKTVKNWSDVKEVEIIGKPEEFQTVVVSYHGRGGHTFYFVDNGHEFKKTFELTQKQTFAKAA